MWRRRSSSTSGCGPNRSPPCGPRRRPSPSRCSLKPEPHPLPSTIRSPTAPARPQREISTIRPRPDRCSVCISRRAGQLLCGPRSKKWLYSSYPPVDFVANQHRVDPRSNAMLVSARSGVGWGAPIRLCRAGGGSASDPPGECEPGSRLCLECRKDCGGPTLHATASFTALHPRSHSRCVSKGAGIDR